MLRRTAGYGLRHLRGVFTFPGAAGGVADVPERFTPKPLDVDALTRAVHEADEIQLHRRGHITASVLKSEVPSGQPRRRRRKKAKMGPREKYLFRKMQQRHRAETHVSDPGSDLTPLYEMTRPWWKFSSLPNTKQTLRDTHTPEEHTAIHIIRKTIEQNTLLGEAKPARKEAGGKLGVEYFQSAEAWTGSEREISLTEQIARKLHKRELQSKHPYLRDVVSEDSDLEEALEDDPTFQQDALKLEAESEELRDVESWVQSLKSFARRHKGVLESMEAPELPLSSAAVGEDSEDALGDMGQQLQQEMAESGINVARLEQEAQREMNSA